MIQLTDNIFCVELTQLGDVYKSFRILPPDNVWTVPYLKYSYRSIYHTNRRGKDFFCREEQPLEPGTWTFLFTTKGATNEDKVKVVGKAPWINHVPQNLLSDDHKCLVETVDECFDSLMVAKGCNTDKNYALILKLNDNETSIKSV